MASVLIGFVLLGTVPGFWSAKRLVYYDLRNSCDLTCCVNHSRQAFRRSKIQGQIGNVQPIIISVRLRLHLGVPPNIFIK